MHLKNVELLEAEAHCRCRKVNTGPDLLIDDKASSAAPAEAAKPPRSPGAWLLLSMPSELLLALREHGDGVITDLSMLQPAGAVLAGDMSEMQPSDLLNFLHQGRRTGVLLARSDGVERGIVLIEGNVAWGGSTSPGERLGELLARLGLVDHARLEALLRDQIRTGERKRLGQLLVDKGVLGPE